MDLNKKYKKWIVLLIIILSIIGLISLTKNQDNNDNKESKVLKIGNAALNIEIANTDAERIQGLSGRLGLSENDGLLFVFDKEGYYSFWMKDMNFPIDIAWLDKNKRITHIEKDVLPETYPKTFDSSVQSLYVLETKANFFENSKIKIGDVAEF
jgi:uncharacterized protein